MNINKTQTKDMFMFLYKKTLSRWQYLALTVASLLLVSVAQFYIPQITQGIIDIAIPNKNVTLLVQNIISLLLLVVFLGLLNYISTCFISVVSQNAISDLRGELYTHILGQDMEFFETNKTGDMMTRVVGDIGSLQDLISPSTLSMLGNIFTFFSVLIFMLFNDFTMTIYLSLTFPLLFLTNRVFGKKLKEAHHKVRNSSSQINNQLQTALTSVSLIKNYTAEDYEAEKFIELSDENRDDNINATKTRALFGPIIELVSYLGTAIVLGYGAMAVINGNMTVGMIVAYLSYLRLLQAPIRSFSNIITTVQRAMVSYERIEDVMNISPKITDSKNSIDLPKVEKGIYFNNVSFSYNNGENILDNISFSIPQGKSTALVGSSGSGKTTITKLLARLYDVSSGEIYIDNNKLNDISISSLRQNIGIVSQDITIIDGSIGDNLTYGSPNATQQDILNAANAANILSFIDSLPDKFDTQVGERGVKLSGGQKQRISIARAFLRDSQILILDEATASLDNESEFFVQQSLDLLLENRTCLVIAHRLSTIQHADQILVLEDGKIVESGKHNILIDKGGRYEQLYNINYKTA